MDKRVPVEALANIQYIRASVQEMIMSYGYDKTEKILLELNDEAKKPLEQKTLEKAKIVFYTLKEKTTTEKK